VYVSSEIVVVVVTIIIFDSSSSTESGEFREIVNVEADYRLRFHFVILCPSQKECTGCTSNKRNGTSFVISIKFLRPVLATFCTLPSFTYRLECAVIIQVFSYRVAVVGVL
jgi:hypothetical protein